MTKMSPFQIKNFRKQTGLSQKAFAQAVNLPIRTYRSYESGERGLTIDKFRELKEKLGYYQECHKNNLRAHIDYLRLTFPSLQDLEAFCENFLHCHLSEFTDQETRLMNYTHLWQRGNIWIFDFFDKSATNNYQTCLQLSGQGCREMELLLEHKGISWQTFLQNILYGYEDVRVKRLDIALDELYKGYGHEEEHIQIPKLIDKLYAKEIVLDTIRKWNITGGGSFTDNDDINGVDLGEIARGIVNKEIQVYDGITRFGAYKPDEKWQELFGGVEPLKLSTSPQPYSIERTIRWLTYQVANSLALVSEADKIMQTEYMKMIQNSGEITDRGEAILRLLKTNKHYEH